MSASTPGEPVKALFAIDARTPDDVFEGWHPPQERWNGFAVPAFDRANAENVIAWVARTYENYDQPLTTFQWDGDILIQTDHDGDDTDETRIEPDAAGRYGIGAYSWTWDELRPPPGEPLAAWLRRVNEDTHVNVAAQNIMNERRIAAGIPFDYRHHEPVGQRAVDELLKIRGTDPETPLDEATVAALELAPTGERHPYTWAKLTDLERSALMDIAVARAVAPAPEQHQQHNGGTPACPGAAPATPSPQVNGLSSVPLPDGEIRIFEPDPVEGDPSRLYACDILGISISVYRHLIGGTRIHIDETDTGPGYEHPLTVEVFNGGVVHSGLDDHVEPTNPQSAPRKS